MKVGIYSVLLFINIIIFVHLMEYPYPMARQKLVKN